MLTGRGCPVCLEEQDIRVMDPCQQLERQRQSLLVFRNNPEISEEALSGALYEIEQ